MEMDAKVNLPVRIIFMKMSIDPVSCRGQVQREFSRKKQGSAELGENISVPFGDDVAVFVYRRDARKFVDGHLIGFNPIVEPMA
ncbi:MAG: hypothetical protein ACI9TH_000157 [Kiritimatiellia bacterium]|jgi:hypothetical protein